MRRERSRQPLFVGASGGEHDEDYEILVGKINQTTSTAADVDSGKKFVDANQDVVIGTSTYKADYIALNQSVNTINNNLESVITGSGSGGGLTVDQVKGLIDGTGTSFTIPDGTTSIKSSKFLNMANLANVDIPDSVTSIESSAFINCTSLTSVELPSGLTSIGYNAFNGCTGLTSVELPSGLTSIGSTAFGSCSGLKTITFLGTPTTISITAFSNCHNLTEIYVPWNSGDVSGAPWGAVNASVIYGHTP